MTDQRIYVDRTEYNLGDLSNIAAGELRSLVGVPDGYDLWRIADWGYREKLGGPMTMDEKVTERVYFGPGGGRPARFYTAPRYINASKGGRTVTDNEITALEQIEAPIVTLCGSTKFKDAINAENSRLTQQGNLVISLGVFGHTDLPDYDWNTDASALKTMLDRLHFQKIRMADRVHVVDVDGYYGESTAREIEYARSLGKSVTFMSKETDQ